MNLIPWRRKKEKVKVHVDRPAALTWPGLWEEVDRIFDQVFHHPWDSFGRLSLLEDRLHPRFTQWMPSVDIADADDAVTVEVEIPGMEASDIEVSIQGRILTIAGQKESSSETRSGDTYHSERIFGGFRRCIELPENIAPGNTDARYEKGILTVRVAKDDTRPAASRRIAVR